jgi:hypothetical protein
MGGMAGSGDLLLPGWRELAAAAAPDTHGRTALQKGWKWLRPHRRYLCRMRSQRFGRTGYMLRTEQEGCLLRL